MGELDLLPARMTRLWGQETESGPSCMPWMIPMPSRRHGLGARGASERRTKNYIMPNAGTCCAKSEKYKQCSIRQLTRRQLRDV